MEPQVANVGCSAQGVMRYVNSYVTVLHAAFVESYRPLHRGAVVDYGGVGHRYVYVAVGNVQLPYVGNGICNVGIPGNRSGIANIALYAHGGQHVACVELQPIERNVVHLHFAGQQGCEGYVGIQAAPAQIGAVVFCHCKVSGFEL